MIIGIGNDHVAVDYKEHLITHIEKTYGHKVINFGTDSTERFDYPKVGKVVANAVVNGEVDRGIVICGTGIGIGISANKVEGIRCAICSEPYSAKLSREHNDSNMIAFGSRVIGLEMAKMIVDEWLQADFEGGRHQKRIDMIN